MVLSCEKEPWLGGFGTEPSKLAALLAAAAEVPKGARGPLRDASALRGRVVPSRPRTDSSTPPAASQVRNQLHAVLCFSPVGQQFRAWCMQFPALANSTVIDWFHPWPHQVCRVRCAVPLCGAGGLGCRGLWRSGATDSMP